MFWVILADLKTIGVQLQKWISGRWKRISIVLGILAFVTWGLLGVYYADNARFTGEAVPVALQPAPYALLGAMGLILLGLVLLLCFVLLILALFGIFGVIFEVAGYGLSVWQRAQQRPA